MKVFVGDDTGLAKEVSVDRKAVVQKWGEQTRARQIQRMCFGDSEDEVRMRNLETVHVRGKLRRRCV